MMFNVKLKPPEGEPLVASPEISANQVRQALITFDTSMRGTDEWKGWEENKNHHYAISANGQLYPVKAIVSLASGVPRGELVGGQAVGKTNSVVKRLGFTVVNLRDNPDWTRDEVILALDLYLRHRPRLPGKNSLEVEHLSSTLRRLGRHLFGETSITHRNPNGVGLKLSNFLSLDPEYTSTGKTGMPAISQMDREIWQTFGNNPAACHAAAEQIMERLEALEQGEVDNLPDAGDEEEAQEGRLATRFHRYYERARSLPRKKKEQVIARTGSLTCECCKKDFTQVYGTRAENAIEVHHRLPVSQMPKDYKTKLKDLAIVCANCHRIIHGRRPWLTVDELRTLISTQR